MHFLQENMLKKAKNSLKQQKRKINKKIKKKTKITVTKKKEN